MNCGKIGAEAKQYLTLDLAKKIKGGMHLKFKENSALYRERNISDMWCYTHPETGDPMLQLENKNNGLIREFNLRNQLEQVRNYFKNANAKKNEAIALKRQKNELNKQCKEFDELITRRFKNRDDCVYTVNNKEFDSYFEAKQEALKLKPEFKEVVDQRDNLLDNLSRQVYNPYMKNLLG